jgi:hypothetical protein
MNAQQGRDAFAKFAAQLQRQAKTGGGGPGRGLMGGGAGLLLLVGGGVALSSSLFNGEIRSTGLTHTTYAVQSTVVIARSSIPGEHHFLIL